MQKKHPNLDLTDSAFRKINLICFNNYFEISNVPWAKHITAQISNKQGMMIIQGLSRPEKGI